MRRPEEHEQLRQKVREACADFPDAYWRELAEGIPGSFHRSDDEEGLPWRVHPEEYDGLSFSLTETTIILEEINRSGGGVS